MIKDILNDAESRMRSSISVLNDDLQGIRTGRANTGLVEKVMVDYYDTPTPLVQLANLSVPEAQTIRIQPYDQSSLALIERAIQASDLGLSPNSDGNVIHLNIPPLTTERRKDLVKQVGKRLEEARVALRNIRRSAIDDIRECEREKIVSEDESKGGQDDAQKLTDKYVAEVEDIGKRKEQEIMDF